LGGGWIGRREMEEGCMGNEDAWERREKMEEERALDELRGEEGE